MAGEYLRLMENSSVFNGLAQVIAQSTREACDIKLHATSLRLASTDIRIVSQ